MTAVSNLADFRALDPFFRSSKKARPGWRTVSISSIC